MSTPESSELAKRLEAAERQLVLYARDLRHVFGAERERAEQLRSANRQLQAYARDLRSSFLAEQKRAQDLERAFHDTVLRLVRATRSKDDETGAHVVRLSHYARYLALERGWKREAAQLLFDAAPMHDVGKIGVPDRLLQKQDSLTESEWEVVRRHPLIGAELLGGSASPLLELARSVALCHHERWDGTGYPRGLRGEKAPLAARIVMLVDQYDALRTQRPYKPAFDHARACDVILNGDGRTLPQHFDPELLVCFRHVHPQLEAIYARFTD